MPVLSLTKQDLPPTWGFLGLYGRAPDVRIVQTTRPITERGNDGDGIWDYDSDGRWDVGQGIHGC
mgnify:CR=1 FL=1